MKSTTNGLLLYLQAFVLFLCCSSLMWRDVASIGQPPGPRTTFTVVENQTEGEIVGQMVQSGGADFSLVEDSTRICNEFFTINENTSIIRTVGLLDREAIVKRIDTDQVHCFVSYFNLSARIQHNDRITINVLDINDEVPQFNNLVQPHILQVTENVAAPTPLLSLEPIDNDSGANKTVIFSITSGDTNYFKIKPPEGDYSDTDTRLLFLQKELDFEVEQNRMFNLTIRISDMGSPTNTFDQQIVIVLNNTLDEPPTFPTTSFEFQVLENHPVGIAHPFANVTAANAHQALGSIFYYICERSGCERRGPAGVILVNEVTGGLYLNSSLDFDAIDAVKIYSFYVTATIPATGSSQNVYASVTILGVNDNAPYVTCINDPIRGGLQCPDAFVDDKFTEVDFDIVENGPTTRLWLSPHDEDSGAGEVTQYKVSSDPQIDVTYTLFGNDVVVNINEIDREVTPNVTISFTIFNDVLPYLSSTVVIRVHVGDINDNAPLFTNTLYNAYVSEHSPINKEILRVEASDSDAGSNADITYAIAAVDKPAARNWFQISPTTGAITVATRDIDYHDVEGVVVLNVTATDNGNEPLSSLTFVEVKVVPAITFSARSHQAFASYNLAAADLNSVYVEFQTSSSDGLLLYQQGAGSLFTLSLEERRAVLKHGAETWRSDETFVDNTWHSVLVEKSGEEFRVNMQRVESGGGAPAILLRAQIQNCTSVSEELLNREEFLFVGGFKSLSVSAANSPQLGIASDFIGAIRNVIIGGSQVNLRCPQEEGNTLIGVQRSNLCRDETLQCHPLHSTGCVDYAEQSFCSCRGGFPSQVCRATTGQANYAPIRLHGTGHMSVNLSHTFLYDLEMLKRTGGDSVEDGVGPGVGARRKRKQVSDPESSVVTLQRVEIRFRPVELGNSVLLHSENNNFVHRLTITETATVSRYAVKYVVFDKRNSMTTPSVRIPISDLTLQNRTEYHVSITYTNTEVIMDLLLGNGVPKQQSYLWDSERKTILVEQPDTTLSIGGAPGETDFFVGCIGSLKVDKIHIPLSGLVALSAAEGGLSNNSVDAVEPYCDLCDHTVCPNGRDCVSNGYGETACACPAGHIIDEPRDICVPIVVTPPDGGLSTSALSTQSYYYIAGGTAGGALLIILLIFLLIFIIGMKRVKVGKRKRTYSITASGILPPQRTSKAANEYVHVEPRRNPTNEDSLICITSTYGRPECHERGSSVSTFQEHADDADPELDEPPRLQRRKSTVSAESGIRTDTERESSLRGMSRMDDSGTDYTPQESESDDVISSCFMEPIASPAGIHLVESASSLMGVPIKNSSPTVPLTPQERKLITPLRPESIRLSVSEDDRRDTDLDTDFSLHKLPPIHQNIPMQRESDSDTSTTKVSDGSTPKWYKSSTASDNERESERALKNRAYYPTRSKSMPYQPHPPRPNTAFGAAAPEYVPPPSISMRKSASPVFPRSPSRRLPPTMMPADSPLTRNTRKYENYPAPPYSMRSLPRPLPSSDAMRERNTRGALPSYENHHFQHQISAPQPYNRDKDHLSAQQGRHVYFAKSSQTLHYCRSMGAEHYPPPPPLPPQQQQNSHSNSRLYYTLASGLPSSIQYRQNRSFSSGDAPPSEREQTQFQDLKNVSTINPISYWEMQDRLKPAVDQVDPYQVLSEPYIQFEDVSTDLSVSESQVTLNAEDGPDHEVFESQGGGEGAADIGPGCFSRLQDHEISSVMSESQSTQEGITHFPSADCSNEYTATINGTSSSSSDLTPKFQPINGFVISSQQSFDV